MEALLALIAIFIIFIYTTVSTLTAKLLKDDPSIANEIKSDTKILTIIVFLFCIVKIAKILTS